MATARVLNRRKGRWLRRMGISAAVIFAFMLVVVIWFLAATRVKLPVADKSLITRLKVENPAPDFYRTGRNWLKKSSAGLWELYIEGRPFDRGVINGMLAGKLVALQEKAFIDQIREMIPSDNYLRFLKYFIFWFNRDLDRYVTEE
ncbi:MAG: peptidase C45, partial [Bacteroidota bacterium]